MPLSEKPPKGYTADPFIASLKEEEDGPNMVIIGPSLKLVSLDSLARELALTRRQGLALLKNLSIPCAIAPGDRRYFSMVELERVLFRVLRVGGRDFKLPGSDKGSRLRGFRKLPPEMLKEIQDPTSPYMIEQMIIGLTHGHLKKQAVLDRLRSLCGLMKESAKKSGGSTLDVLGSLRDGTQRKKRRKTRKREKSVPNGQVL